MKLAQFLAIGSLLLFIGCSSAPAGKRDIATIPSVPAECSLPAANIIQRTVSTVGTDATLLGAQVTCHQGVVALNTIHPNGRAMVFTLPPAGQAGNAMFISKNEQGTVTDTNVITFPASTNVANQNRLRLAFKTFSVDYHFDLANLTKLRETCTRLNKPLNVGGTPVVGDLCQMNHLASSPITRFSHNGTTLNPRVTYSCMGLEPRYKLSLTSGAVTEEVELGAVDGNTPSEVVFRRTDRNRTGRDAVSSVKGTHQKNVFAENRLAIQARGQNFLVEFNPEMLARHQQWCAVNGQIIETVPAPAAPQTAPAVENPVTDPVILQ
jgi:hypothetical protein